MAVSRALMQALSLGALHEEYRALVSFLLSHFFAPDPRCDLRLRVFFDPNHIPLLRTAVALLRNQASFVMSSHLSKELRVESSCEESFQSAGSLEENDYIRLENIRLLFDNKPPSTSNVSSQCDWLRNLSFQVDAMNVYEQLIRDSAENAFGANKGLAAKLSSFLHHGLTLPVENLNREVRDHIVKVLFSSNDFIIFQRIIEEILVFDRERNRSIKERTEWLHRIESLTFLPRFAESARNISPGKNSFFAHLIDMDFFYDISLGSMADQTRKEIDRIMANPMYLMGELEIPRRFDQAIDFLKIKINYFLDQKHPVPEARLLLRLLAKLSIGILKRLNKNGRN